METQIYELKQAVINLRLSQISMALETHDKNASGKPGAHNEKDVADLNKIQGQLEDILHILKTKINK